MTTRLAFILSLPRSGSTVLTSMMDQRKGVISPPESSFPQILGEISPEERNDPTRLAALYIASTFPGTPLSLEESKECMLGSDQEILIEIGKTIAKKLGRCGSDVRLVVWKTTRTVGMNGAPLATDGNFVILRRHPENVFESQFRVHFGLHNRHPLRFALFRESYEAAFRSLPSGRKIELDYESIPNRLPDVFRFLGHQDSGPWEDGKSSLQQVAADRPWLSQILEEFKNDDQEKRERLSTKSRRNLDWNLKVASLFRPVAGQLRRRFDLEVLKTIRQRAADVLASSMQ